MTDWHKHYDTLDAAFARHGLGIKVNRDASIHDSVILDIPVKAAEDASEVVRKATAALEEVFQATGVTLNAPTTYQDAPIQYDSRAEAAAAEEAAFASAYDMLRVYANVPPTVDEYVAAKLAHGTAADRGEVRRVFLEAVKQIGSNLPLDVLTARYNVIDLKFAKVGIPARVERKLSRETADMVAERNRRNFGPKEHAVIFVGGSRGKADNDTIYKILGPSAEILIPHDVVKAAFLAEDDTTPKG